MTNFQLSTPVYVAGAIVGAVMVLTSIVVLFVQPANVQYVQNSVVRAVPVEHAGGYVWVTPTPCVVSSYVVTADSCQ